MRGNIMSDKNIIKLFKESLKNKNSYIPNILTASRLAGAFVVPGLFLTGNIPGAIIATAAFGATDFFDGKIARATNGYSEFGRILDPIVDKVFAIVPAIAILPNMPILAANIGVEAIIAYINSKSYTNNGNPKSSFLGKFKTFCLFPTIGICYLNTALNFPIINILSNAFCLGTLGIQSLAARDYYKKAKEEEKKENNTFDIVITEEKHEKNEKLLEDCLYYQNEKEKEGTSNEITSQEKTQFINSGLEKTDFDQLPIDLISGLIEETPEELSQDRPKTFIKTKN